MPRIKAQVHWRWGEGEELRYRAWLQFKLSFQPYPARDWPRSTVQLGKPKSTSFTIQPLSFRPFPCLIHWKLNFFSKGDRAPLTSKRLFKYCLKMPWFTVHLVPMWQSNIPRKIRVFPRKHSTSQQNSLVLCFVPLAFCQDWISDLISWIKISNITTSAV